jgi:hypothetical protein
MEKRPNNHHQYGLEHHEVPAALLEATGGFKAVGED